MVSIFKNNKAKQLMKLLFSWFGEQTKVLIYSIYRNYFTFYFLVNLSFACYWLTKVLKFLKI
jgi:hypothetical protein